MGMQAGASNVDVGAGCREGAALSADAAKPRRWKYLRVRPLVHPPGAPPPAPFRNPWLQIRCAPGARVRVSAGYAWDGCTGVPDWPGTLEASCLHDAVYQFAEELAARWNWPLRRVLRWGDAIFHERMLRDGTPRLVAGLYYLGVRLFGPAFHFLSRWLKRVVSSRTPKASRSPCGSSH